MLFRSVSQSRYGYVDTTQVQEKIKEYYPHQLKNFDYLDFKLIPHINITADRQYTITTTSGATFDSYISQQEYNDGLTVTFSQVILWVLAQTAKKYQAFLPIKQAQEEKEVEIKKFIASLKESEELNVKEFEEFFPEGIWDEAIDFDDIPDDTRLNFLQQQVIPKVRLYDPSIPIYQPYESLNILGATKLICAYMFRSNQRRQIFSTHKSTLILNTLSPPMSPAFIVTGKQIGRAHV